jgi:phosphatidylglycerol---prolipoprotein diacylglyceryl transferase
MFPKVIEIGDFFLPTYGLLVALAFLIALAIASRLGARTGLKAENVVNLGIYCAIAALLGAKLFLVLEQLPFYLANPGELFSLSMLQAGGVFFGGLVAALVVAFLYMRAQKLPALLTADAFAPGIALGHAIGRVGCFAAGCCWGDRCDLPWAVTFRNPDAQSMVGVPLGVPLHPTQLYEAGAEAIIFVVLYRSFMRPHYAGAVIGLYLMLYPAARFVVEFLRAHEEPYPFGGPLSSAQWMAVALFVLGVYLFRKRGQLVTPQEPKAEQPAAKKH